MSLEKDRWAKKGIEISSPSSPRTNGEEHSKNADQNLQPQAGSRSEAICKLRESALAMQKRTSCIFPVAQNKPSGNLVRRPYRPRSSSTGELEKGVQRKKKVVRIVPSYLDAQLTQTRGQSLQRKWSHRLAMTIANKNRPQVVAEDSDEDGDDDSELDNCIFGNQIRFTIMVISTLCLSSILANILTFNFTFICMAGEQPANFSEMEEPWEWESLGYNPDLDYNSLERSSLFMAVAVGALLAVFPLTVMLNRYGSRVVFGLLGYISAVSTLLMPLCAEIGFAAILLMRVIQGAGFSACLPVMGSITSHWSTLKQNGIFIAILSSFLQIAPIFTMPVSGILCVSELGWETVYYLHGVLCLVLFTVFLLYHRNTPIKHPLVQKRELMKVMFGKGSIYSGPPAVIEAKEKLHQQQKQKKRKKRAPPPAKAMYSDRAIWAILVAAFGNFMGTQLSLQFMPTYINRVLHFPVEETGLAAAISPILMFFIKLSAGLSSDRLTSIKERTKLRVYNSLALGSMGLLFIVLASIDPHANRSASLAVLIASTSVLGFNSGGFFKSSQMVSRQHSHFTLANISFLNCVCMLLVPLMNEMIAPENEPKNWAIVLWIHAIILLSTNAFFCVFCSSQPAKWTAPEWRSKSGKVAPTAQKGQANKCKTCWQEVEPARC